MGKHKKALRNIKSNISALRHKRRGKKADKLRDKVKKTRHMKVGIKAGRIQAVAARTRAFRFNRVKGR